MMTHVRVRWHHDGKCQMEEYTECDVIIDVRTSHGSFSADSD